MDYWFKSIDYYCERVSAYFWAEPINALSNISFIIAAAIIYTKIKNCANQSIWVNILTGLCFITGIGSFLFHTFANTWSLYADIIPIFAFMITFVAFCLKKIFSQNTFISTLGAMLFLGLTIYLDFGPLKDYLNGSIGYFPALALLLIIGLLKKESNFLFSCAIFSISLIFRTLDNQLCSSLPIGTHFIWHILNGILLWKILGIVIAIELEEHKI